MGQAWSRTPPLAEFCNSAACQGVVLRIRQPECSAVNPERQGSGEGNTELVGAAAACYRGRSRQEGTQRAFHSEDQSRVHSGVEFGVEAAPADRSLAL